MYLSVFVHGYTFLLMYLSVPIAYSSHECREPIKVYMAILFMMYQCILSLYM